VAQSLEDRRGAVEAASSALAQLPALDGITQDAGRARDHVNAARAAYGEARARHDGLERDAKARTARLAGIMEERTQWGARASKSSEQIAQLTRRSEETQGAIDSIAGTPKALAEKRQELIALLQTAEGDKRAASDALAEAENAVRAADQHLREAQEQASGARESHARAEAKLESSRARHAECEHKIAEQLQCEPGDILAATGLNEGELQHSAEIERKLQSLRDDRERLGGVNLRADEEAAEVAQQLSGLLKERDDLVQAVNKLRGGISSLNREGRQRLLDAFTIVNEKFGELFTTLFGGGRAELQLIESDDPLEAGLEILANPPGKKPTVLSLLSGGEQTLTALALIFAVFLTNPSPICVLDEVDAPLDDHNVERFCNLLDAMLERTETRFLIITHHEYTMSRMHRLFGVTMAERGVSQLVSVDLGQASALAEAS
jgi:chromosome segregation protein